MGSLKQVLFTTTIIKTLSICREFFCLFICLFALVFVFVCLFCLFVFCCCCYRITLGFLVAVFCLNQIFSQLHYSLFPFQSQFAYNCNHLSKFFRYILYKLVPRVIALISGKQEFIDMKAGSFISCGIYSKNLSGNAEC